MNRLLVIASTITAAVECVRYDVIIACVTCCSALDVDVVAILLLTRLALSLFSIDLGLLIKLDVVFLIVGIL